TNFNLVVNPYTSNINWGRMWNDLQVGENKGVVDATMYYYEDNSSSEGDQSGWKTYNANTTFGDGDGFISMGQAFGVLLTDNSSNATGTLYFRTEFQTHEGGNVFHKKSKSFGNYFELNTISNNLTDKIYFKFNESTSDAYDANHDAYKFNSFGETPTPYFVSSDNKRLAICEMPKSESVELGFVMDADGEVVFSLSNVQDFDEIILEDKSNNTFTDLTKNQYSFQHSTDDAETGRFTLHFKKETLSEVEETVGMKVYSSSNNIFIQSNRTLTNATVNLFNTNGQLILSKNYSSLINEQINTNISSGVYLIEVSSNENRFTTRINIKH
ncbi:MAG: T9SS type A sorting domain-containing protein, partial [Flavobacteriales bacterium]|nr:T9SS type A sorting domain-containing protein [Flavobacteriales bacterium]